MGGIVFFYVYFIVTSTYFLITISFLFIWVEKLGGLLSSRGFKCFVFWFAFQSRGRSVVGSLTTYVNRVYDVCITKYPDTAMTKCDVPCQHTFASGFFSCKYQSSFPSSVISPSAIIFFKAKILWKFRLQIDTAATVNFPPF